MTDQNHVIALSATQTIDTVKALHDDLQKLFDRPGRLCIDASQVAAIDTASLQLLAILFQTANQLMKPVSLTGASAAFIRSVNLLGLGDLLGVAGGQDLPTT
jgi:anti-anti-sigma regulatory factor